MVLPSTPYDRPRTRWVITGALGQLGSRFRDLLAGAPVLALDLPESDITKPRVAEQIAGFKPDVVLHGAAYTDVDGCARNPDLALKVNALGTKYVALGARAAGARLVYISTNEVFPGDAGIAYDEFQPTRPINPYGRSKAAGEEICRALTPDHYIARTAWLFGPGGNNFVKKVLARAANGPLTMVADEIGSPTYAPDLAAAVLDLVDTGMPGTYHLVNEGVCSRYQFAAEILRLAGADVPMEPVALADFPRPSTVPPHSPLRNIAAADLGIRLRPWQDALAEYVSSGTP